MPVARTARYLLQRRMGNFETWKARMIFDFEAMTPLQRFDFLTGTVVPRPIALVTTQSPDGLVNAAPYSFFNIMGVDPPVVACTVLPTPDGRLKDTGRNIRATHEFVVNLVSEPMAQPMNITCIDAPPDVEELELAGLAHAASRRVKPPRILNSPVSFECVLHTDIPLSPNQFIAIGRVVHAHVEDAFVLDADQFIFDTPALRLIGAMHAAKWYARTSDRFAMDRPIWADWINRQN
jgi:flavin reductase (DIM6/NTAB) family NADH-FMN oxidoreductase RutF